MGADAEGADNATCSGPPAAGVKAKGIEKSLVGTDGATLSALKLGVGLTDGARTEAVGARTEVARGDSEINASAAEPSPSWASYPSAAPDAVAEDEPGTGAPVPIWSAHSDANGPSDCTSSLKDPDSTS